MIESYPMYAIDIDQELSILEKYFNVYKPIPEELKHYLKFIPTKRMPLTIEDDEYYKENSFMRSRPYMPYLCLPCVENYVMFSIYINSPDYELFLSNPLKKDSKNFLENYYGIDQNDPNPHQTIITSWLENDMLSIDHFNVIEMMLKSILKKISKLTNLFPNHIWKLNYETCHVILINEGDIKSFRFEELRGHK